MLLLSVSLLMLASEFVGAAWQCDATGSCTCGHGEVHLPVTRLMLCMADERFKVHEKKCTASAHIHYVIRSQSNHGPDLG
jgi:hypothetical protein